MMTTRRIYHNLLQCYKCTFFSPAVQTKYIWQLHHLWRFLSWVWNHPAAVIQLNENVIHGFYCSSFSTDCVSSKSTVVQMGAGLHRELNQGYFLNNLSLCQNDRWRHLSFASISPDGPASTSDVCQWHWLQCEHPLLIWRRIAHHHPLIILR